MTKRPTYVMCTVRGPPALVRIDYAGDRVFFGDSTGLQQSYKLFKNNDSAGIATASWAMWNVFIRLSTSVHNQNKKRSRLKRPRIHWKRRQNSDDNVPVRCSYEILRRSGEDFKFLIKYATACANGFQCHDDQRSYKQWSLNRRRTNVYVKTNYVTV